uniref:Uncharacterized protein n=1 Tax=Leersia perrieri TaxID=77586 RepID=A0A0D9V675_9ORYZ
MATEHRPQEIGLRDHVMSGRSMNKLRTPGHLGPALLSSLQPVNQIKLGKTCGVVGPRNSWLKISRGGISAAAGEQMEILAVTGDWTGWVGVASEQAGVEPTRFGRSRLHAWNAGEAVGVDAWLPQAHKRMRHDPAATSHIATNNCSVPHFCCCGAGRGVLARYCPEAYNSRALTALCGMDLHIPRTELWRYIGLIDNGAKRKHAPLCLLARLSHAVQVSSDYYTLCSRTPEPKSFSAYSRAAGNAKCKEDFMYSTMKASQALGEHIMRCGLSASHESNSSYLWT